MSCSAISAVVSLPSQAWGRCTGLVAQKRTASARSMRPWAFLNQFQKVMSRFQVLKARSTGALSGLAAVSRRTSGSRLLLLAQTKSLRLPGVSAALPLLPVRHSRVFWVPNRKMAPSSVLVSAMTQSLV